MSLAYNIVVKDISGLITLRYIYIIDLLQEVVSYGTAFLLLNYFSQAFWHKIAKMFFWGNCTYIFGLQISAFLF